MSKFAVIKTGGKQYKVSEGLRLKVEKLESDEKKPVSFEEVLLVADEKNVSVGTPTVSGAKVTAKVLGDGRAKKVSVVKYKPKSRYRRRLGHRQHYTEVQIEKIA